MDFELIYNIKVNQIEGLLDTAHKLNPFYEKEEGSEETKTLEDLAAEVKSNT